jgi:hypothetical protein
MAQNTNAATSRSTCVAAVQSLRSQAKLLPMFAALACCRQIGLEVQLVGVMPVTLVLFGYWATAIVPGTAARCCNSRNMHAGNAIITNSTSPCHCQFHEEADVLLPHPMDVHLKLNTPRHPSCLPYMLCTRAFHNCLKVAPHQLKLALIRALRNARKATADTTAAAALHPHPAIASSTKKLMLGSPTQWKSTSSSTRSSSLAPAAAASARLLEVPPCASSRAD